MKVDNETLAVRAITLPKAFFWAILYSESPLVRKLYPRSVARAIKINCMYALNNANKTAHELWI